MKNDNTDNADNVVFLGPYGATFSHDAYCVLSEKYSTPKVFVENYIPAQNNGQVLKLIIDNDAYGCLAMETLAEGRVSEPLESFIDLLSEYDQQSCPIRVAGAVKMRLNFCLLANHYVDDDQIDTIIAHPKALGACKENIKKMGYKVISVSSNGEACRMVAEDSEKQNRCCALGPISSSTKYGLSIIDSAFEDKMSVTTFFQIVPKGRKVYIGQKNRALIIFKTKHSPGSLVDALIPFKKHHFNLIQIHSMHVGNHTYHFAIEIEINGDDFGDFKQTWMEFTKVVDKHLIFGPFEVYNFNF